jgi:hypothetical protein
MAAILDFSSKGGLYPAKDIKVDFFSFSSFLLSLFSAASSLLKFSSEFMAWELGFLLILQEILTIFL